MEGLYLATIGLSFLTYLAAGFMISAIVGSSISLYHSIKEEERRTDFIVFSSLGLGLGILSAFFGAILVIVAMGFTIAAMAKDEKIRNLFLYIGLPIIVAIALTGVSYYFINKVENTELQQIDINSIQGLDGVSNNGKMSNSSDKSSSNQTTETTTMVDTNNNGIPDSEEDLNNNGIPDIQESFEINVYQEGDDNHNGVPDVYEFSTWSTDGDGTSVSPTDVNE